MGGTIVYHKSWILHAETIKIGCDVKIELNSISPLGELSLKEK